MPAVSDKKDVLRRGRRKIPNYLIYEILGNRKIYYKDYKKVLSGELPLEAVAGSSDLQAWIISLIAEFLFKNLDSRKYRVLLNEVGYFYTPQRKKKWLNLDMAVISRKKLKEPEGTYLRVPPEVAIEVDTKADISQIGDEYFIEKTEKLLESGVEKVVWIFTNRKKVQIAQQGKPWIIVDFDFEFELLDNLKVNIQKLIEEDKKKE
ncbi:Uma2 family endonuclease [Persephonella sp.]